MKSQQYNISGHGSPETGEGDHTRMTSPKTKEESTQQLPISMPLAFSAQSLLKTLKDALSIRPGLESMSPMANAANGILNMTKNSCNSIAFHC